MIRLGEDHFLGESLTIDCERYVSCQVTGDILLTASHDIGEERKGLEGSASRMLLFAQPPRFLPVVIKKA